VRRTIRAGLALALALLFVLPMACKEEDKKPTDMKVPDVPPSGSAGGKAGPVNKSTK